MIGKNNLKKHYERRGEKVETYSIKKFKVGAASVLIGVGLFFGAGAAEASDSTSLQQNADNKVDDSAETNVHAPSAVEVKPVNNKIENTLEKVAEAVSEKINSQTNSKKQISEKAQQKVDKSLLLQKIEELKAQLERIKNNSKQQSMIDDATSKLASAESLAQSSATQQEVDKKAKEISSLTSILKSIKAEETPKENKNQDSRNGKKMEEGVSFRTGTDRDATSSTASTSTGIGADVVDATTTPKMAKPDFTDAEKSKEILKQVTWLDFSDKAHWKNVKTLSDGNMALQEGSVYEKEVMKDYFIKITVKSLKPFQATEIYKKRLEAGSATEEEKATYDPTARNWYMKDRGAGAGDYREEVNIVAKEMDQWTEIKKAGIDTGTKKQRLKQKKLLIT